MRFLLALFISGFLVLYNTVIQPASAEYFGDFEHYEVRELNGQDGWSDVWNTLLIDDAVRMNGSKSLSNQDEVMGIAYKEFPKKFVDAGVISTYIRVENNSFSDNQPIIGLFKGITEESVAIVGFSNNYNEQVNMLTLSHAGASGIIPVGQIQQGVWQKIAIGWRTSDSSLRVKLNDGEWSPWVSSETTWGGEELFGVRISLPAALQYGKFYLNSLMAFVGEEIITEETPVAEVNVATSTELIIQDQEVITTSTLDTETIPVISEIVKDTVVEVLEGATSVVEEVVLATEGEVVVSPDTEVLSTEVPVEVVTSTPPPQEEILTAPVPEVESISDSLLNIDNLTVTTEF